jgi:hypothetical protein
LNTCTAGIKIKYPAINNLPTTQQLFSLSIQVKIDNTLINLNRIKPGTALIRGNRLAISQINHPVMQRTGDTSAMHDTLRQRPTLMRTMVTQGKHLISRGAEYRHITSR